MKLFAKRKPQAERRAAAAPVKPRLPRMPWRWVSGIMAGIVLLSAGGWAVRWLLDPHTLPIRRVLIAGQFRHLSSAQLQNAVAEYVTGGFFTVDVDAVMRAARSLPWVETASVRRVWPDTLRLEVVEQVPLARWNEHDLVNKRGERFTPPADTLPEGLPELQGPAGLEAALTAGYFEMGKALAPAGLKIARLAQDERRSWRLVLDNNIELRLGRDDAYQRLLRFVRLYPKTLAPRATEIAAIDLRYTNGFAVAWNHQPDNATPPQRRGHS